MHILHGWHHWAGWQQTLGVWLSAVVYIFLAGGLGAIVLPAQVGWGSGLPEPMQDRPLQLTTLFVRWDAGYYWEIAHTGYTADGTERAFFPLYPLLVRGLSNLTALPIEWSGLLLSLTAFAILSLTLYHWVRRDYPPATALRAVALLCFSPVAFYFVAFYAEPLYVMFGLLCLYCARRGWFLPSGLCLAFAGAARPAAFVLGVAYALEVWRQRPATWRARAGALLGLMVAPLGTVAYYNYLGHPNGIMAGMEIYNTLLNTEWDTRLDWPWALVGRASRAVLFGAGISADWFSRAFTLHDFFFALCGLSLALWSARRLPLSASALLLLSVLHIFITSGPGGYAFDSAPRRLTVIAPYHVALALWLEQRSPRWRWGVWLASALWLGVLTAWFASGRWVS